MINLAGKVGNLHGPHDMFEIISIKLAISSQTKVHLGSFVVTYMFFLLF